jgi:hypothetical protein
VAQAVKEGADLRRISVTKNAIEATPFADQRSKRAETSLRVVKGARTSKFPNFLG